MSLLQMSFVCLPDQGKWMLKTPVGAVMGWGGGQISGSGLSGARATVRGVGNWWGFEPHCMITDKKAKMSSDRPPIDPTPIEHVGP